MRRATTSEGMAMLSSLGGPQEDLARAIQGLPLFYEPTLRALPKEPKLLKENFEEIRIEVRQETRRWIHGGLNE